MAEEMISLSARLAQLARDKADAPAVSSGEETLTYGQFHQRTNRLARGLQAMGVKQGDLVTLGLPNGIGFVEGTVSRLPGGPGMPLPHVGWSTVDLRRSHPVTDGIKQGRDFYFVHSYAMHCENDADWIGATNYGTDFVSIVGRDNVVGFQFHPEKSQANGLKLLENFCYWDGQC